MRQQMCRRLLAAVVGVAAVAATAPAQQPVPVPNTPPAVVLPPVPVVPNALPGPIVAPAPSNAVIHGYADTAVAPRPTGVGAGVRGYLMDASGGYFGTSCQYGANCNNGCGSCKADLGFVLGSCRSFFAPCGPNPMSCNLGGHGLFHHGGCGGCGGLGGLGFGSGCNHTPVYGTGRCAPFNPCFYDSYVNH
jgi:hypothetical protein